MQQSKREARLHIRREVPAGNNSRKKKTVWTSATSWTLQRYSIWSGKRVSQPGTPIDPTVTFSLWYKIAILVAYPIFRHPPNSNASVLKSPWFFRAKPSRSMITKQQHVCNSYPSIQCGVPKKQWLNWWTQLQFHYGWWYFKWYL